MLDEDQIDDAIKFLYGTDAKLYHISAGAGAGFANLFWGVPGSSRFLMAGTFSNSQLNTAEILGREVEGSYVSEDVASGLATTAYFQAQKQARAEQNPGKLHVGLGLTAAVQTDRDRRGKDQVFVAVRTSDWELLSVAVQLTKGIGRRLQGRLCETIALNLLLRIVDEKAPQIALNPEFIEGGDVVRGVNRQLVIQPTLHVINGGLLDSVMLPNGVMCDFSFIDPKKHILAPVTANPYHFGHEAIARQAEQVWGKRVVAALNVDHPDKGEIPREEVFRRAGQFLGVRPLAVTRGQSLFVEKARAFPGVGILVGADAASSMLDPKYYGGNLGLIAMLEEIARLGNHFYVAGRRDAAGNFYTCDNLLIPGGYHHLFRPVSATPYEVSSSDIRSREVG